VAIKRKVSGLPCNTERQLKVKGQGSQILGQVETTKGNTKTKPRLVDRVRGFSLPGRWETYTSQTSASQRCLRESHIFVRIPDKSGRKRMLIFLINDERNFSKPVFDFFVKKFSPAAEAFLVKKNLIFLLLW